MALYTLAPQPWLVFLDDAGLYIPNGQLAVYAAGTTTPAPVYTSASGTAHPFPITLDATGRVPGGLYLQPGLNYKFVLHAPQIEEPLDGAIIRTQDNVEAVPHAGGVVLGLVTGGDHPNLNVGGVDIIEYTGAGDVTIRGMVGGVVGQSILIRNLSPTATIWLSPEDAAAAPGTHLRNFFAVGMTPLRGERSSARYTYISTGLWVLEGHAMGRPITPPFTAADYSTLHAPGTTWTVDAGDILHESFYLNGRNMIYSFRIENTVVAGGTSNALTRRVPFGWQAIGIYFLNGIIVNNEGPYTSGAALLASPWTFAFQRLPVLTDWVPTGNAIAYGQITITLE